MKKIIFVLVLFFVACFVYSIPYTHYTSDYLRIRKDYDLNSQIITVLEPNMGVELVEKGKKDTIDGITSNWVKVIAANGYSGWCFAGYLKPIEKDVSEILAKEVEKVKAGELVKQASQAAGGNGGGSPTFAQGGGKSSDELNKIEKDIIKTISSYE